MSKKMSMETKNVSVLARPKYYISEDEFYLRAREYLQKVFPGKTIPDGNNYVSVFMNQLEHDVTFWTENSKKSLSPEEIILLAITKRFFNCDVVCLSYVCQNSILDSDLINSLMFITSGFFSFEGWTIEAEKYIVSKIDLGEKFNQYDGISEDLDNGCINDSYLIRKIEHAIDGADQAFQNKISTLIKNLLDLKTEIEILENRLKTDTCLIERININKLQMKKNKEKSEENKKKIDENRVAMISLSPDSTEYHKLAKENEKLHKENLRLNKELKTEEEKQLMNLSKKREYTVNSMNSAVPVIHIKDQLDWVNIAKYQKQHLDKEFYKTHKNLVKESILNSKLVDSPAN